MKERIRAYTAIFALVAASISLYFNPATPTIAEGNENLIHFVQW